LALIQFNMALFRMSKILFHVIFQFLISTKFYYHDFVLYLFFQVVIFLIYNQILINISCQQTFLLKLLLAVAIFVVLVIFL
jgi:hypothetical protein